jgi:hypothetical protein
MSLEDTRAYVYKHGDEKTLAPIVESLEKFEKRAARIEAVATKILEEITEAKKLGQIVSFEWIRIQLKDALKP